MLAIKISGDSSSCGSSGLRVTLHLDCAVIIHLSGPTAMPASDAGFKIAARVSGKQLAAMAGVPCDGWASAVSEVQTTERLADRVFQARRGKERFLVYMEA